MTTHFTSYQDDPWPEQFCGAQDWGEDDDGGIHVYGTCELHKDHESVLHLETRDGAVWAAWSGPAERAPIGVRSRIVCPEGHTGTVIEVSAAGPFTEGPEACVQCDGGDCDGYWYPFTELRQL